jgi:TFIIH basal transcription factor complex TTD-A subunit
MCLGVLVECDPSIKAIIVKIDSERNDFIVEELDDQTLVIKEGMLQTLKLRLEDVSTALLWLLLFGSSVGVEVDGRGRDGEMEE